MRRPDLAQKYGAPFRFVEAGLRSRCAANGSGSGRSIVACPTGASPFFDDFARFEAIEELVATEHLVLDTTRAMPANEAFLRSQLDVWPAGLDA
ncbi:MAG: hypothetical protein U0169_04870 [Polyangiaceae bacterium]